MVVTVQDLRGKADRLLDALDVYDRFVEGWPYDPGEIPDGIEGYLAELDSDVARSGTSFGVAFATGVKELYHEAREAEAAYAQQARKRGRPNWSWIVAETEPVREAAQRVHTAGYGVNSETEDPDYLLPRELCPAHLVSMNSGSSPITFEDRVAQYRAVADQFDVFPEIVYHPGSGHDVSLSKAFSERRVVYADVDEAAMADLSRAGYEAVGTDAAGYELERGADVIVFRNAGLMEEAIVAANLRPGGWVLANDHLESARHLTQVDSLELVGVVPDTWAGDSPAVDTSDLGAYLSRFETDRERGLGSCNGSVALERDEQEERPLENHREAQISGQTAADPRPRMPAEKGTPLDLYVFRADS